MHSPFQTILQQKTSLIPLIDRATTIIQIPQKVIVSKIPIATRTRPESRWITLPNFTLLFMIRRFASNSHIKKNINSRGIEVAIPKIAGRNSP